jgi:rhamnogalacturonyl hydrolase YesR
MIKDEIQSAHRDLWHWCRARDFAGYDPYDALNSRLFQATPLKHSRIARLAWTQLFKRSPLNFRPLALAPAERNPKGTALFALAALADYRRLRTVEAETDARALLDDLLAARLTSQSGAACWGYNFDWQSRSFFAPRGTSTVVPTAFAARAFIEAAQAFGDESYLQAARRACDFILGDLNRSEESADEVCFSYSPLDRTRVFNASLLAGEVLASVGALTGENDLVDEGMRVARYVVRRQSDDGSWAYGVDGYQSWADNFHTAFVLTSLSRIIGSVVCAVDASTEYELTAETQSAQMLRREFVSEAESALQRGYDFWRERFFLANGWPKYFPDRLYPADAHSAGAALVALMELQSLDSVAIELAETIAHWAIENLRDRSGFFYYQRRRFHTVRIPYMRWSGGWMMYGLARLIECQNRER